MGQVNWEDLVKGLGEQGMKLLRGLVDGAEEDLKKFGADIGKDLVRCIREGRPEVEAELREQIKVLGEIYRIRLLNTTWAFVGNVFTTLAQAARIALVSAGAL